MKPPESVFSNRPIAILAMILFANTLPNAWTDNEERGTKTFLWEYKTREWIEWVEISRVQGEDLVLVGVSSKSTPSKVFCFRGKTGDRLWEFSLSTETLWTFSCTRLGETRIAVQTDSELVILDLNTGQRIWSRNAEISSYPTAERILIVHDRKLSALEAESGKDLWHLELEVEPEKDPRYGGLTHRWVRWIINNGSKACVAMGLPPGYGGGATIYCVDLQSGELVWKVTIDEGIADEVPPCAINNRLFLSVRGIRSVYCLNLTDGRKLWEKETLGHPVRILGIEELLIVSYEDPGGVLVLNQQDGKELWKTTTEVYPLATKVWKDKLLLFEISSDRGFLLDLQSGKKQWALECGYPSCLLLQDNMLVVLGDVSSKVGERDALHFVDLNAGDIFFTLPLETESARSFKIGKDVAVILDSSKIYCYAMVDSLLMKLEAHRSAKRKKASAHLTMAKKWIEAGNVRKGIEELELARALDPGNEECAQLLHDLTVRMESSAREKLRTVQVLYDPRREGLQDLAAEYVVSSQITGQQPTRGNVTVYWKYPNKIRVEPPLDQGMWSTLSSLALSADPTPFGPSLDNLFDDCTLSIEERGTGYRLIGVPRKSIQVTGVLEGELTSIQLEIDEKNKPVLVRIETDKSIASIQFEKIESRAEGLFVRRMVSKIVPKQTWLETETILEREFEWQRSGRFFLVAKRDTTVRTSTEMGVHAAAKSQMTMVSHMVNTGLDDALFDQ